MARGSPEVQYAVPTPEGWQRNLLIGLFVAYVLELVLHRANVDIYSWFAWHGWAVGFEPWQPLTRFLVQGASTSTVINVLIGLVVLFFALPMMSTITDRGTLARATLAGAVGGTVLPLVLDVAQILPSVPIALMGWGRLVMIPFVILGLARPSATVYLVVFPVLARWILWGTLVLSLLFIMVDPSHASFEMLGIWLGTAGWWTWRGPGRRRRDLTREKTRVERELRRFEVIEGGAGSGPQSDQGRDDDWIH